MYHTISSNPRTISKWIIAKYGRKKALSTCWRWSFMRTRHEFVDNVGTVFVKDCGCRKRRVKGGTCLLELKQIYLVETVLSMGADINSGIVFHSKLGLMSENRKRNGNEDGCEIWTFQPLQTFIIERR